MPQNKQEEDLHRIWERAVLIMYDTDPQEADFIGRGRIIECSNEHYIIQYPKELPASKVARRRIPDMQDCLKLARDELISEAPMDPDLACVSSKMNIKILPEPRIDNNNV